MTYDEVEQLKVQVGRMDDLLTGTHKYTIVIMLHACIVVVQTKTLLGFFIDHRHGMLSKSKGQTLRVTGFTCIIQLGNPQSIPKEISDFAMKAAINFVDVSVQHSVYLAGRRDLREEIDSLQQKQLGIHYYTHSYSLHV